MSFCPTYCLLLFFSQWWNGTLSQVGFLSLLCLWQSKYSLLLWEAVKVTSLPVFSSRFPLLWTAHQSPNLIHSSCWLDTIIIRISGCYHKVYTPKVESNVFPSLKPSALLDSSLLLLAAPSSQMLRLKTLATLLMPASLYFKYQSTDFLFSSLCFLNISPSFWHETFPLWRFFLSHAGWWQ